MGLIIDGLESIEILNKKWTDGYALGRHWETAQLSEPVEDLGLFFDHVKPGQRMLDVGCGWARYVRLFVDAKLVYTGIDLSEEMVKVSQEAHPGLDFRAMSYRSLQFEDESFEGLWACCSLNHDPKRNIVNVLRELKRVLVKGGVMMVILPAVNWSGEGIVNEGDDDMLWLSDYELSEFEDFVVEAGFEVVESNLRVYNGAQSVLARK